MARIAKATRTTKPAVPARRPGRPRKVAVATPTKAASPPAKAPAVAKVSKGELRDQVDKLERANATLRSKSREANRAAKVTAARIAELESLVAKLQKQAATDAAPAKPKLVRGKRQSRTGDSGDTAPRGGAADLDQEADSAHEHLEQHLGAG